MKCTTETKNNLLYVSWAEAWEKLKEEYSDSNYRVYESDSGMPYFFDKCGGFVKVGVTVCNIENVVFLPIMDYANDSMKTEDPEELLMRKEFFKHLFASLRRLPEELRTAVVLREFSGMNYEEISEVMEIPLGTVRSRIFRARARLREMLEPYVYES